MTRGIEDMLNIPSMEDILKSTAPVIEEENIEEQAAVTNYGDGGMHTDAIATAERHMELMSGDGHSESMDEIHKKTLQHADDLMDLGYNVDQRSQATIFEKANMLYKTAIDAKNSKRDMQLKAMKLQLDAKKLELDELRIRHEIGDQSNVIQADATILADRNEMLKSLREQRRKDKEEAAANPDK